MVYDEDNKNIFTNIILLFFNYINKINSKNNIFNLYNINTIILPVPSLKNGKETIDFAKISLDLYLINA